MAAPWQSGAQVRIIGHLHGQLTNNVLNFGTNTVVNDPTQLAPLLVALATAIVQCVAEHLLDAVTQDWTFDGVEARQTFPAPSDPVFVASDPADRVGTSGPTSVSFASAMAHIRTGTGGKSGRGRIFFPPPGEAEITNSALDASAVTDFNAMLACIAGKFIGVGATEPWRIGVLSRKLIGSPPNWQQFNQAFREATSLDMATDMSVMSSRRKQRGV